MRTALKILTCLLLIYTLGLSCSKEQDDCVDIDYSVQTVSNPNGDSELTLLMRAMEAEAKRVKRQIKNEEPFTLCLDYENILTAHPSELEKTASAEYEVFAKAYLQNLESLKNAKPAEALTIYNNMVGTCMSCHAVICPGPLDRIKKLK